MEFLIYFDDQQLTSQSIFKTSYIILIKNKRMHCSGHDLNVKRFLVRIFPRLRLEGQSSLVRQQDKPCVQGI